MSKFGLTCSIKTKGYNARFIQFERSNFSDLGFSKFENPKYILYTIVRLPNNKIMYLKTWTIHELFENEVCKCLKVMVGA